MIELLEPDKPAPDRENPFLQAFVGAVLALALGANLGVIGYALGRWLGV